MTRSKLYIPRRLLDLSSQRRDLLSTRKCLSCPPRSPRLSLMDMVVMADTLNANTIPTLDITMPQDQLPTSNQLFRRRLQSFHIRRLQLFNTKRPANVKSLKSTLLTLTALVDTLNKERPVLRPLLILRYLVVLTSVLARLATRLKLPLRILTVLLDMTSKEKIVSELNITLRSRNAPYQAPERTVPSSKLLKKNDIAQSDLERTVPPLNMLRSSLTALLVLTTKERDVSLRLKLLRSVHMDMFNPEKDA